MTDDPNLYEFLTCGECGIRFAAPKTFIAARRAGDQNVKTFYCPNGHQRAFRETENDRLRRERDNLKQQTARLEDERAAVRRAEAAATAAKKQVETALKRTMNRVENGVCAHCNRSFSNLKRHMKTCHATDAHPEMAPIGAAGGSAGN